MKPLILTICITVLFFLNTEAQVSYHIYGTIDKTDVNQILIRYNGEFIDSAAVKNGSFDMKGNYKTQEIVRLFFVAKSKVVQHEIILDNGDYNVTIDSNSNFNIVTTSQNHNLLKNWYNSVEKKANKRIKDSLLTDYKLQIEKGNYNLSVQYLENYRIIQLNLLNYYKKIALDHPDCFAIPYLLKDEGILTQENFGTIFEKLSTEVKNNGYGPYFKSILDKKRTQDPDYYQHYFSLFGNNALSLESKFVDGNNYSQSSLKGKWILLDFWASWCGPCRAEFPYLKKTFNQFKNKNFVISSVSIDIDTTEWQKAINEDNCQEFIQTIIVDFAKSEAYKYYQVNAIPSNFLINPEGRIVALNLRGAELTKTLNRLIK